MKIFAYLQKTGVTFQAAPILFLTEIMCREAPPKAVVKNFANVQILLGMIYLIHYVFKKYVIKNRLNNKRRNVPNNNNSNKGGMTGFTQRSCTKWQ